MKTKYIKKIVFLSLSFVTFLAFQNFNTVNDVRLGANGYSASWDSRFLIMTHGDADSSNGTDQRGKWNICVFRPEKATSPFTIDGLHRLINFNDGALSDTTCIPFLINNGRASLYSYVTAGDSIEGFAFNEKSQRSDLIELNALGIVPVGENPMTNPFKSNKDGVADSKGAFLTYDFYIYTQAYNSFADSSLLNPRIGQYPKMTVGRMQFKVTMKDPMTAQAAIHRIRMVKDWEPLRTTTKQFVIGLEPTVTVDGGLMAMNYQNWGAIFYSYNPTPANINTWSDPKTIAALNTEKATIGGQSFQERYAVARHPLKSNLGEVYGPDETVRGAYPWISWEGSELYYSGAVAVNDAVRSGWSVFGEATGGQIRVIDGGFREYAKTTTGPDQYKKNRIVVLTSGLASTSSIWNPFKEINHPAFPTTREAPVTLFYHSNFAEATEISFKGFKDGNYLTYLNMNRGLKKLRQDSPFNQENGATNFNVQYEMRKTPDLSGRNHFGTLVNDAYFPLLTYDQSQEQDFYGEHINFKPQSYVQVDFNPAQFNSQNFSAEVMVNPLKDLSTRSENAYVFLIYMPGVMNVILEKNRMLHVSLDGTSYFRTGFIGPQLPVNKWSHVGVTWNEATGNLRVYVNAVKIYDETLPTGFKIKGTSGSAYAGPMGKSADGQKILPYDFDTTDILALDEFKISRLVRSADEMADSAHIPLDRRNLPALTFNSAVQSKDLRLMGQEFSLDAAQLGSLLFKDPRLSKNKQVSCATCHDANKSFADGLAKSRGVTGLDLEFTTPTLLNRGVGRYQTFNGKSTSIEDQLWLPLNHPDEMGLSVSAVVSALNKNSIYKSRFTKVFGAKPNAKNTQQALAAFVNSILTDRSRYDRFLAGEPTLTEREIKGKELFFGKARCAACHSGVNLSDDQFHRVGFFENENFGQSQFSLREIDQRKVKTPTLRNISKTAPYFHNGSIGSLAAVVELYNAGSVGLISKDSEIKPLNLTANEKALLIEFLGAFESNVAYAFNLNLAEAVPLDPPNLIFDSEKYFFFKSKEIAELKPSNSGSSIESCSISPALPKGLSLNSTSCAISGVPQEASPTTSYEITAKNKTGLDENKISITVSSDADLIYAAGGLVLKGGESRSTGVVTVTFRTDGNLVITDAAAKILWQSGTTGKSCATGCVAQFQIDDGNLVLYQGQSPYWASGTVQRKTQLKISAKSPYITITDTRYSIILWSGQDEKLPSLKFNLGQFLIYNYGSRKTQNLIITLGGDGNLLLMNATGQPLWSTKVADRKCKISECYAIFQADGNLVLYQGAVPYWATATEGRGQNFQLNTTAPYLKINDARGISIWNSGP